MKNDFGRSDSHLGSHFANSKLVFLQNWESITDFMRIVAIPPIYVLFFFLFFRSSLHFTFWGVDFSLQKISNGLYSIEALAKPLHKQGHQHRTKPLQLDKWPVMLHGIFYKNKSIDLDSNSLKLTKTSFSIFLACSNLFNFCVCVFYLHNLAIVFIFLYKLCYFISKYLKLKHKRTENLECLKWLLIQCHCLF